MPFARYMATAYAAPMARLFSRQKPRLPCGSLAHVTMPTGPAWCPGGRTAQNALRACRAGGIRNSLGAASCEGWCAFAPCIQPGKRQS